MSMIPDAFEYSAPASLTEAIKVLAAEPTSQPIAGGNGLLTQLKRGELTVTRLVDLRKLNELRGVGMNGAGRLRIGALTTLTDVLADPTVRAAHLPGALSDAISMTGDVQARNRATIGGTLATAAQGSDLSAALLALDATAEVVGPRGRRMAAVARLLDGSESLVGGELITAVELAPAEPGSAYLRVANRANLHALCGVAVTVALGADGGVTGCRIAVTGAMPYPQRLPGMEAGVIGTRPPVAMPPRNGLSFVNDQLASAEYRRQLTQVLAERAFAVAVARAHDS
jgi:aerobic carbon-monoxide dehydrogenase medium subunit